MQTKNVAVVGASGYIGEEMVRLLMQHPGANLTAITSRTYKGQRIGDVFPRYREADLTFTEPDAAAIAAVADVAFLALPHGLAATYAIPLLEQGLTVIDVSADFRLRSTAKYATYYGAEHPSPELLAQAVYGAPERKRAAIRGAKLIACPGCYPTSVTIPTCALLRAGVIRPDGIIVSAMSGVSGAGRKESVPLLFSECNESLRAYNAVGHRHTPEIEQELAEAAGVDEVVMNFIPHLVPVTRGIHSTIVANLADAHTSANDLLAVLRETYADEPFVRVLNAGELADSKHVTWTNRCEIGVAVDKRTGRAIISSAIDNLTKGGSGQAVQCFNIVAGFPETTGLNA